MRTRATELTHLVPVKQRVLNLYAHKRRPTIQLGNTVHLCELPRSHVRRANVANFAALDKVVQRLHRFCDRGRLVKQMDL